MSRSRRAIGSARRTRDSEPSKSMSLMTSMSNSAVRGTLKRYAGFAPPHAKMLPSMQLIPNASDILLAVIDATPDAIFVKDLEGRYVLVNRAAARFVGRTPDQVIGRHDFELYPEETAERFVQDDKAVLASGTPMSFEGVASSTLGHAGLPGDQGRLSRQGRQHPRHLRHLARHHRAARRPGLARADARGAVSRAENGSGRPADRRHRARLQQHPDGDSRQPRAAADAPAARRRCRRRS